MAIAHSQVQMIPPNTWTEVLGTDLQVFVRAAQNAELRMEMHASDNGEQYIEVRTHLNVAGEVAIRTPW